MWKYGRKFIQNIFKKRSNRTFIYSGLATRVQADSDRSDIRMFEVGISSQRYGDYEQSTGATAQQIEGERLITIAKKCNLFVDKKEWENLGERKRLPSGESVVYLSDDETKVIKVRDPFAKSALKHLHSQDVIYEHLVHNILFPDTRYEFLGISTDVDGVRILLGQKYISHSFRTVSQKEIDTYLVKYLGLKKENQYFYGNDYVAVTDVSADSDNVLTDGTHMFFIDPIIKFKRPAIEILEYYYSKMS